jgi:photosystem II stability/assembly factor-like uncharacterized protein
LRFAAEWVERTGSGVCKLGELPMIAITRLSTRRTTILRKAFLLGLLTLMIASQAGVIAAGTNVWTCNGPEGGRIQALATDPVTPSTLYAGTDAGGVFKSTNGGAAWSAVNSGLTDYYGSALAIDPVIPNTLYAGTGGGSVFAMQQFVRIY